MGLLDSARRLWQNKTSNPDAFGVTLSFTAPGGQTATIVGHHTKHHLQVDTGGQAVNGTNIHVTVSEKLLTDLAYPVRNADGEVTLYSHRVSAKDSTGNTRHYVVREQFPNETVGVIVMILGEYQP